MLVICGSWKRTVTVTIDIVIAKSTLVLMAVATTSGEVVTTSEMEVERGGQGRGCCREHNRSRGNATASAANHIVCECSDFFARTSDQERGC
jgi:hypothetical protein